MAEDSKVGQKALHFVLGGFIGAAAALLLAPGSREETRKLIAMKTRESADFIADRAKDVTEENQRLDGPRQGIAAAAA
jgi:gas vesicle protein